uniref:Uncharacterized protein n=1 Tax=Siphoviridae sp. ctoD91 TaxID=2827591 RepID=A0A8S5LIH9_9CAUD|nr:MAG TPA: hypothetical protein [Siphoviridae sp. ctoD91]
MVQGICHKALETGFIIEHFLRIIGFALVRWV